MIGSSEGVVETAAAAIASCAAYETKNGSIVAYTYTSVPYSLCDTMRYNETVTSTGISKIVCCNTDLCNSPKAVQESSAPVMAPITFVSALAAFVVTAVNF